MSQLSTIPPGMRLGPYQVLECLGEGGMGVVYRGYDAGLKRTVALKVLPSSFLADATFAERFEHEAQLWASLEHPCIVPVYFAGIEEGRPFIAMRYIEGGSLDRRLQEGRLPFEASLRIISDVARALDFAHAQGVVHRDVKPANVLLDPDGRAYLSDFGIARVVSQHGSPDTSEVVGTPSYMAPEQARSQSSGPQADIYSLGCLAYEALTGTAPFGTGAPVDVIMRHLNEAPTPPTSRTPTLPPHVDAALLKVLAKDPSERWPSASLFVQALRGQLSPDAVHTVSLPGRARVTPPAGLPKPGPWRRRAVLLALVLATAAGAFYLRPLYFPRAAPSVPSPLPSPTPSSESARSILTAVSTLLDQGDYPTAADLTETGLQLHPNDLAMRDMHARVRRAWKAEQELGLWEPAPQAATPSPLP